MSVVPRPRRLARALIGSASGAAALPAGAGYDDGTGVGSPNRYIQSYQRPAHHRR